MAERSRVRLKINNNRVNALLESRHGPLGVFLVDQVADDVLRIAQRKAPVYKGIGGPGTYGGGPIANMLSIQYQGKRGPRVIVGGDHPKLKQIVAGRERKPIYPKATVLTFRWEVLGGKRFTTPSNRWPKGYVEHPGFPPNNFLRDALNEAMSRI